jgi:hypothetical protein
MGEVLLCQECRQPVDLKKKYVVTNRATGRTGASERGIENLSSC